LSAARRALRAAGSCAASITASSDIRDECSARDLSRDAGNHRERNQRSDAR
jgi:hypothetical protein